MPLLQWLPPWLLWLLPVPLTTGAAVLWLGWSGRTRGPGRAERTVQHHERFRAALAAPLPEPDERG